MVEILLRHSGPILSVSWSKTTLKVTFNESFPITDGLPHLWIFWCRLVQFSFSTYFFRLCKRNGRIFCNEFFPPGTPLCLAAKNPLRTFLNCHNTKMTCICQPLIWFILNKNHQKIWRKKIGNMVINNYILENWCVSCITDKLSQNETQIAQIQLMLYMSVLQKSRFVVVWQHNKFTWCLCTYFPPLGKLIEGTQQKVSS